MVMREWLNRCPLIAILRGIEAAEVVDVFSELFAAGIVIAEIPLNSPEPFKSIEIAAAQFSDRMLIGAGTVTQPEDVERVQAAGAGSSCLLMQIPQSCGRQNSAACSQCLAWEAQPKPSR